MTASSNHASDDRTAAWSDAHEPSTTSARLAEIVGRYPEFAKVVVRHPNSYPELEKWAQGSGLLNPRQNASGELPVVAVDPAVALESPRQRATWGQPANPSPHSGSATPRAATYVEPGSAMRTPANDHTAIRRVSDALQHAPAGTARPTPAPRIGSVAAPAAGQVDLGMALKYAWRKYAVDPWPYVLLILMTFGLVFISYLATIAVVSAIALSASSSSNFVFLLVLIGLSSMVPTFVGVALSIGLVRASIDTVRGLPVSVKGSFRRGGVGHYLAFWVLIGVGMSALAVVLSPLKTFGTVLLVLVVVGSCVFTLYAPYLILDREMSAIGAIRASCRLAAENLGQTFISIFALGAISLAGALLFGVGVFITGPLTLITLASIYLSAQGENSAE